MAGAVLPLGIPNQKNAMNAAQPITRADFKPFEVNLYNAQCSIELNNLCHSDETAKEAKAVFYAILETRNKLSALMDKLK